MQTTNSLFAVLPSPVEDNVFHNDSSVDLTAYYIRDRENATCYSVNLTLLKEKEPDFYERNYQNVEMPFSHVFWMCLLHLFPFCQSAFNWLFYAFLNRNLRNSTGRPSNAVRSAPVTSTLVDNGNSTSQVRISVNQNRERFQGRSPFLVNLQNMGTHLKTVGVDSGQALMKLSPFRSRSNLQSRWTFAHCIVEHITSEVPPV